MSTEEYIPLIVEHEGTTDWLYADSRGFTTTGVGHLVKTPEDAQALRWVHQDGSLAKDDDVSNAWKVVHAAPVGHAAGWYRQLTTVRLTPGLADQLVVDRLENEFLPGIRKQYPSFDDYPFAARMALVDMTYNLGVAGLGTFKKMRAAILAGDFEGASKLCHRSTCREERNAKTAELLASCAS